MSQRYLTTTSFTIEGAPAALCRKHDPEPHGQEVVLWLQATDEVLAAAAAHGGWALLMTRMLNRQEIEKSREDQTMKRIGAVWTEAQRQILHLSLPSLSHFDVHQMKYFLFGSYPQ